MTTTTCDDLRDLKKGRNDWKVRCRIIREWRGVSKTGELFKGFNVLLLDAKNCMMHAFAPNAVAQRLGKILQVGKLYLIKNFQVKDYTEKDLYRPVNMECQIIFNLDTFAVSLEENEVFIPKDMFDFYQFEDLKPMATQQLNLIDVIGIIKQKDSVLGSTTKNGKNHVNTKFKLSDGKKSINVTFWGVFAQYFQAQMKMTADEPIILIIASGKISCWQDQIDICNYSPTHIYFNYAHHSVSELRKRLEDPSFIKLNFEAEQTTFSLCSLAEITKLDAKYIKEEVICRATIRSVIPTQDWKISVCTSCYTITAKKKDEHCCTKCNRIVPQPLHRFNICAIVYDNNADIKVRLNDREMKTILGLCVDELKIKEDSLSNIEELLHGKQYTLKVLITQENIGKQDTIYAVTNILSGFIFDETMVKTGSSLNNTESGTMNESVSLYHLDNLSVNTGK